MPPGRLLLLALCLPTVGCLDGGAAPRSTPSGPGPARADDTPAHLLPGARHATAGALGDSPDWTAEGSGINDDLGTGVGSAGDVNGDGWEDVYVASYSATNGEALEGRVQVYLGSAAGLGSAAWSVEANRANALLGTGVAAGDVNGDGYGDLLVGSPGYANGQLAEGRALLFLGSAAGLASSPAWTYEPNSANHALGSGVAIVDVNGDGYGDVAVGGYGYTSGQSTEGRALVFLGSGSGPPSSPTWTFESNVASARLGASVRSAGDVNADGYEDLVVGAWSWTGTATSQGRVYLFHGSASGLPASASWTAQGAAASDAFGVTAAGVGDVDGDGYGDLLVGANGVSGGEGEVSLYRGGAAGLGAAADWTWRSGIASAGLGTTISAPADINGDGYADLALGAHVADSSTGRAWVFWGGAGGPGSSPDWEGTGSASADWFGRGVGVADPDGDGFGDLLVSAPQAGSSNGGQVYLFRGSPGAPGESAAYTEAGTGGGNLGYAVASAGDIDGDGYDDLVAGAPAEGVEGALRLVRGGPSGVDAASATSRAGADPLESFGAAIDGAGDVNGDGYADVIVGAPTWDGGAYVYLGSAGGLGLGSAWSADDAATGSSFGASVAGAGDVNGDGYADVLVGAPDDDTRATGGGAAFLYLGGAGGPSTSPDWELFGAHTSGELGSVVAAAGDVNGDGYADVLLSDDAGEPRTQLLYGSAAGLPDSPDWTVEHPEASTLLHGALGGADVDGDGYDDIVVARADQLTGARVQVWRGGPDGPGAAPDTTITIETTVFVAVIAARLGDVDGDGRADLVVGLPDVPAGGTDRGVVAVYRGGDDGLASSPAWTLEGTTDGARLGSAVAASGDHNGDGLADLLIGEPGGSLDDGALHVHLGGEVGVGRGTGRLARGPSGGPVITPGGVSSGTDGFEVVIPDALLLRGGAPARLEVEVKPIGDVFDGTDLRVGSWTTLGAGGGELTLAVTGLEEGVGYHWRARLAGRGAGQRAGAWRWGGTSGRAHGAHLFTGGAQPTVYADADGDNWGDPATAWVPRTPTAPSGYVTEGTDCDDGAAAVNPGATEACNGVDDDCDGDTDEVGALGGASYYVDADEDGWGSGTMAFACAPVDGYALDDGDCDDGNGAVNPGADELCNDVDDDCDGLIDPGTAEDARFWYRDNDADGYGVSRRSVLACDSPPGMVSNTTDCNDANAAVHPDADELCNDLDDDCDGVVDPATAVDASLWYRDRDGDGYGQPRRAAVSCEAPPGHAAVATDCDDMSATVYPGAPETCNSRDDDCDGTADEPGDPSQTSWYIDADGDGYGAGAPTVSCVAPGGGVAVAGDCDDSQRWVYPGATEVCDGAANNCDTLATWDLADEDGLVSLYAADGQSVEDRSADFSGTPGSPAVLTLPSEGALVFCDGTYYTRMTASGTGALLLMGLNGADAVVLSAADTGRVLDVSGPGATLELYDLTLADGLVSGANGGAVRISAGSLLLDGCVVEDSSADLGGGLYQSGGALELDQSVVRTNAATSGGGLYVYSGTVSVLDTELSSNTATDGGGLFLRSGTFTVSGAHVLDNVASSTGGGLRAGARVTLTDSVIDGNSAGQGGGVYFTPASTTLQLTDTEVTNNGATTLGGGVYNVGTSTVTCTGTSGVVGGFLGNTAGTGGGGVYLANTGGRLQANVCDFGDSAPTNNSPNDIRFGANTYNKGNDQTFTCTGGTCP